MSTTILIADDDAQHRRFLAAVLSASGYAVEAVAGGVAATERLLAAQETGIGLALLDLNMPDRDGLEVLGLVRAARVGIPILVLTSEGSVARSVAAMRAGATDFLVKPCAPERLEVSIRNALALSALGAEVRRLSKRDDNRLSFDELVAASPATREAIAMARRAARSDIPVLITGESGTGKEVFARAIHGSSERAGAPFVAVNCGALPANLIESILFGHERGAFTGATSRKSGKFQDASGGTLFLDEIGELPLDAQVKLLRALQTGEIDPVGASAPVKVDIRLISATNRDLAAMIAEGRFREDLYYRLSVFPLGLPPLRARREDLQALATMFLSRFTATEDNRIEGFSPAAMAAIIAAPWPGNVRQLENTIHRAVVLADGPLIEIGDLHGLAPQPSTVVPVAAAAPTAAPCADTMLTRDGHIRRLIEIEGEAIRRAIALYGGRMAETARRLGIGRSTLYRKIDELRIDINQIERRGG